VLSRSARSFGILDQVAEQHPDRRIEVSVKGELDALPLILAIGDSTTRHSSLLLTKQLLD
jgi:hypothetical protein